MTPRPRVINPVIASPGSGLQHRANRTSMSPTPETITALPIARLARFLGARALAAPGPDGSGQLLRPIDLSSSGVSTFAEQLRRRDYSVADRGEKTIDVALRKFLERRVEALLDRNCATLKPSGFEFAIDQRDAQFARALGLLLAQPLPDPALRARRDDVIRPILARRLPLGGQHLDRVAGFEPIAQRHHPAVDARARQMMADLRMNPIGEIDHRRAQRKIEHVALGREDENFLGEEIVLDGREKFLRVLEILLPFDQPPQPREALGFARSAQRPPSL